MWDDPTPPSSDWQDSQTRDSLIYQARVGQVWKASFDSNYVLMDVIGGSEQVGDACLFKPWLMPQIVLVTLLRCGFDAHVLHAYSAIRFC